MNLVAQPIVAVHLTSRRHRLAPSEATEMAPRTLFLSIRHRARHNVGAGLSPSPLPVAQALLPVQRNVTPRLAHTTTHLRKAGHSTSFFPPLRHFRAVVGAGFSPSPVAQPLLPALRNEGFTLSCEESVQRNVTPQ